MPKPRRVRATAPAWCVTLYFLLASSLGCITLGLLEGPAAVLTTCLALCVLLIALSLVAIEIEIEAKGTMVIAIALLLSAAVVASPQLSDFMRWMVAVGAGFLALCLLAKIAVGHDQWSEPVDLADSRGFVAARWIAHVLWAIRSLWIAATVISVAGALWQIAFAHWSKAAVYGVTLMGIAIVAGISFYLEQRLIAETAEAEEPKEMITVS